jgi:N-acetyl-anhydromuramyl-L-alanine amidase AmpD
MSVLQKIKLVPFAAQHFMDEVSEKKQIYIHHTASSPNPYGVVKWWETTPERVATSFIVGGTPGKSTDWKDGDIIQVFGSNRWAWHLGLKPHHLAKGGPKAKSNTVLNKESIGIEICSWGQLTSTADGFKNYAGGRVADWEVCELATPYKGFKYYQKYTPAQLQNTFDLLKFLGEKWHIPVKYKGDRIFDICPEALQGESGIWSHTSVRPDKFDCFPQPELISMLSAL